MDIQGIEVLNKEPIYTMNIPVLIVSLVLMFALLSLIGFFFAWCDCEDLFTFVAIAVIVACFILCFTLGQKETGRYRYEVTINDEVSFKELYEKYDVIEQKGKIYVIEEKEER